MRVLQALYGRDRTAAAYAEWLDARIREQAKTPDPLASWDDIPDSSVAAGWRQDSHGFLCVACADNFWQVIEIGDTDPLCAACARYFGWEPSRVQALRVPPSHSLLRASGYLPGGRRETVRVTGSDSITRDYQTGDARGFASGAWDMNTTGTYSGDIERPRLEMTGTTSEEGHEFSFVAAFAYDPSPLGFPCGPYGTAPAPYGFRFEAGTLSSGEETAAFTDAFTMLDAIAAGTAAFTGPARRDR